MLKSKSILVVLCFATNRILLSSQEGIGFLPLPRYQKQSDLNILAYHTRFITFILLFFLSIGINASLLAQSPKPDSIKPAPKPLVANTYVPTVQEEKFSRLDDIAKSAFQSSSTQAVTVIRQPIDRRYFTQNIFDIGIYDNPFALKEGNNKKRRTDNAKNNTGKSLLKELFVLTDAKNDQKLPQWLIFVLLGILSFMTILLSLYRKTITSIFQAFFSLTMASNLYREQRSFIKIESFSSYLLFAMSMGTFCFLLPQYLSDSSPFNTFGGLVLCVVGIGAIYVFRYLSLQLAAAILPYPNEIGFYNFIISITNKVIGYLLVPALFLLAYLPETAQSYWLYFLLIILGIIYTYRNFRGLAIGGNTILFHKFHFFVYLCTIEIAPTIILLKMLSIF